jgi:hypothetical protein
MEQKVMLGETDLTSYILPRIEGNVQEIQKTIKELKKKGLEHEKEMIKMLESNNYLSLKYPQIDLSFLGMSNKIKVNVPKKPTLFKNARYELKEVSVPKFSIYNFYGSNKFNMRFYNFNSGLEVEFPEKNKVIGKNLAKVFENEGLTLEWIKNGYDWGLDNGKLTTHINLKGEKKDLTKYGNDPIKNLVLTSQFNGVIPEITIEKIRESETDFKKKHIYIITETKPQEWNTKYVTNDPLVIGIKHKKAYLINHFNTTSLEDLVRNTHTKNSLN